MKILLVVDMQNDFIDGSLGTKEAQSIVEKVISKINTSDNELILFTKDTHQSDYLKTQEGKQLPVEHCIENTAGWCINKDVRSAWLGKKNTIIDSELRNNTIYKNTFGSKDLVVYLMNLNENIDEIMLIGLCTDICIISNALLIKVYFPEVKITVDASCCAGVTPKSHKNSLNAMRMCQINIIGE